jgi:peroxiredoxin
MDTSDESAVDRMIAERFSTLRGDTDWHPNVQRGLSLLKHKRAATDARKRRQTLIAACVLAAAIPVTAFPITRALAQRCVSACVEETAVVRQLLLGNTLTASNTYVPPVDRKMAPDFTLTDASGRAVKLSESRGKVVLLNFWATWCGPCEQEIPWFVEFQSSVEFQRANDSQGFTVLGVSMDEGGWPAVKPYISRKGINYPVMIGNHEVARLFGGVGAIPLTVIIDRSGRIAAIHAGLCKKAEYESDIRAVLNER